MRRSDGSGMDPFLILDPVRMGRDGFGCYKSYDMSMHLMGTYK